MNFDVNMPADEFWRQLYKIEPKKRIEWNPWVCRFIFVFAGIVGKLLAGGLI